MDLKIIKDLSNANGVSGFEDEVVEVVREHLKEVEVDIKEDSLRNVYIESKKNTGDKPVILIDGHSDEVGFMVKSILPNGLLEFVTLGGWIPSNVPAHRVRVGNSKGEYLVGITTSKPPHFMTQKEREQKLAIEDIYIDLGASSYDEVVDLGIEVGAPVVPDVEFLFDEKQGIMSGKAFDNRLGCASVISIIKSLIEEELDVEVVGGISSQEEVGTRGSIVTSRRIKPDIAIVFEGTPADDLYRDSYRAQGALKKGCQIRHRDSSMISNPRFVKFVREVAKEEGIKFQDAVRIGGGTNGGKIHLSGEGVPTVVLGVPTRYAHTHYGYAALEDFKSTVKLAIEVIKRLNRETILSF